MADLPPRLSELIKKAESLVGQVRSIFDGGTVYSVEELIRSAMSIEDDREKRVQMSFFLTEIRDFYRSMASSKIAADAKALVDEEPDGAYLTLIPAHPGGKMLNVADVRRALQLSGVTQGINYSAVDAAADKFVKKEELVYRLKFAECEAPQRGDDATIDFACKVFDKSRLFRADLPAEIDLMEAIETVEVGRLVARLQPPREGRPGRNLKGQDIPGPKGAELDLKFGPGLRVAPTRLELHAIASGAVVRNGRDVDIVPFYIVTGDLAAGQDVAFNGNVLVTGSVLGPVSIKGEDVIIGGSAESATIQSSGDVWIGGGFVGRRQGTAETDGRFYARTISDATVHALGDVVARNAITYSEVTSNGRVVVTEERGTIVGGSVSALLEIVARTIGSDFGTSTSTTVGHDYLTSKRLEKIEGRIKEFEATLAKIELLKRKFAEARVDVTKLPPDKQDMYIAVLQKEVKGREELNTLRRSRERFAKAMKDFVQASVKVLEQLHPPVKVQIVDAVREIRERLERVTLVLNRNEILVRKEE